MLLFQVYTLSQVSLVCEQALVFGLEAWVVKRQDTQSNGNGKVRRWASSELRTSKKHQFKLYLKEKVTPDIQLFYSPKFQPLKCPLSWRNLSRKKRLQRLPFWNCLGSQAVFVWCHSASLKNWGVGGGKNWLGITHKVSKIYFFQPIINFTIILQFTIISEFGANFWLKIILLKSSNNSEW